MIEFAVFAPTYNRAQKLERYYKLFYGQTNKNFDQAEYVKKAKAFIKEFGYVDSADSAKKIAEYILAEAFSK